MNTRSRSVVLYTVIALVLVIAAVSGIILAKNRSSQLSASRSRPIEVAKAPSTNKKGPSTVLKPAPKPAPVVTPPSPTPTPAPTPVPNTGPSETFPSTGPNDVNISLSVIGTMAMSLSGIMFFKSRRTFRNSAF